MVAAFYHRRGLATAERIHHPVALGHSYLGMAVHEDALGDWASALAHYQRAASAFTEAGHLRGWGASTVQIGWLHVVRGSFAAANERSQELLRVGQETSDRHILAWGLTLRGTLAQLTRSADQAVADLEHAVELSQAIPDHANAAQATALLGRCHLRQGTPREPCRCSTRPRGSSASGVCGAWRSCKRLSPWPKPRSSPSSGRPESSGPTRWPGLSASAGTH